jgi:ankyrin repeat protein
VLAAIHDGDADLAMARADDPKLQHYFAGNPAALLSLLERMSAQAEMLGYVRRTLNLNPALAHERYARGRTLLHGAAAAGSLSIVDLLIQLGADPNANDLGGHAPLYCVANECGVPGGGDVVRALVQAGANVNACGAVKHCTALHMAARRGNVEVAKALLDCGADIAAKDTRGDTPLRRAVNCRKPAVIALLRELD